jgi:hypothetical protein
VTIWLLLAPYRLRTGDHLSRLTRLRRSASWLSPSRLLSHHKTRWVSVAPPAPPDLDLGISVAPLAPPALGGSRFPLELQLSVSICGSRAASGSRLLLQHRQASPVPFSLWWLSVFSLVPWYMGIVFQPSFALSLQIGFDSWLRYYLLFCLICKLGYLLHYLGHCLVLLGYLV